MPMSRPDSPPVVARPLFFLDYDGTLAPIVDEPSQAVPHPDAPALLKHLASQYPVWIVTGRHLRDLSAFLPDVPLRAIGLHGAQTGIIGQNTRSRLADAARAVLSRMRDRVPAIDGVRVEDKEHTFAVHYRGAQNEDAIRENLEAWLADLPDGFEAIRGKCVVELRPQGLDKGTAVLEVARQFPDRTPVYLGDDVTDEDAFLALDGDAVTVKIGGGDTAARYRLPDPEAVVRYLTRYV